MFTEYQIYLLFRQFLPTELTNLIYFHLLKTYRKAIKTKMHKKLRPFYPTEMILSSSRIYYLDGIRYEQKLWAWTTCCLAPLVLHQYVIYPRFEHQRRVMYNARGYPRGQVFVASSFTKHGECTSFTELWAEDDEEEMYVFN